MLEQTPTPYRQLDDFTNALYSALALPDSVLVVATPHGLAAQSDRLPRVEIEQQAALGRAILERDGYVKALESVADTLVSEPLLAPPSVPASPVVTASQPRER